MDINKKLKRRRKELGLTMLDVAKKVGVSEGTISRWESGDIANMKRNKIVLLANALEVTPAFIMGADENEDNIFPQKINILSSTEEKLLQNVRKLNGAGRKKADEYIIDLLENPKYTESTLDEISKNIERELESLSSVKNITSK